APAYPDPGRVWELVERHQVTTLGLSPTVIRALMTHGEERVRARDLSSLRILGSTGEPWNPGPWRWYFDEVGGGRCPVINYSGGTEISGGILGCVTLRPLWPCCFNTTVPGIAAAVFNSAGPPVRGAAGDLVAKTPT